jgi:phospholipid-translocating ATPase
MIQAANVGIGLLGKEGMQASLAADYSITKFNHLNILILWFGRIAYKNTATISKFVIHRGLIISFIQVI